MCVKQNKNKLLWKFCRIVRAFLIEEQKIVTGMLAVKAQPKK